MELLPCPFCGKPGIKNEKTDNMPEWFGCSDPTCEAYEILMTEEKWNTRAPSDIEECCSEYKKVLLKENKRLEKRLEEADERIYILERANAMFVYEYKNNRNAALEEAAQIADGWDFGKPIAEEIRKMKEE